MSSLFRQASQELLTGNTNWVSSPIKAIMVADSWAPDFVNDDFLNDIALGDRVGTAIAVPTRAVVAGGAQCAALAFPATFGTAVGAVVFFRDTGVEATSPLLLYDDSSPNLPFPAIGGSVTITAPTPLFRIGP